MMSLEETALSKIILAQEDKCCHSHWTQAIYTGKMGGVVEGLGVSRGWSGEGKRT
jgi:hypothetical protein